VEELLPEFIAYDRNGDLTPEEWLTTIIEAALAQWDLSSPNIQTDVEAKNADALAHIVEQLQSAGIPVCTTMVIDDVIQRKLFDLEAFNSRRENQYLPSAYLESLGRGEEKHQVQFRGVEDLAAFKYVIDRWLLVELHRGGVLLLLGTDAGTGGMGIVPGYSVHDELRILVENGLTPYEAIATGTVNAGIAVERMTGDGDFGTIEEGKPADLILVSHNPLEDVTTIREPLGVMAAGRWYAQQTLTKMIEPAGQTVTEGE
jgi:hypothetical protein